jgi:putative FmdB family regulatory protein
MLALVGRSRGPIFHPVPIYDFECGSCGERFEELVRQDQVPACPACGAADTTRLFSPISPPAKTGLRGAAARKSDATRKSREERRHEGFARQREQRKQQG